MTYETLMAGSEIALSLSTHTMKNYRLKTTVREYVVGQQEPEFVAYSAASSTGWDSSNGGWSSDCSRGHVKDVTKWNNPLRELCQKGGRMTILRLKQNCKDLDGCIVLFNCGFGVGVGKGLPFQMIYQGTLTPLS